MQYYYYIHIIIYGHMAEMSVAEMWWLTQGIAELSYGGYVGGRYVGCRNVGG